MLKNISCIFIFPTINRILLMLIALQLPAVCVGAEARSARLTFPGSGKASVGIVVRDLNTGLDITTRNADKSFSPASILKCVTSASVLLDDREGDCFATEVLLEGEISTDSTLNGNLIVRGVGDPTIESSRFPDFAGLPDSIAAKVRDAGIRKISGCIEIDSVGFCEQGPGRFWEADDLKWYYGAGLYPINFRDNTVLPDRSLRNPCAAFTSGVRSSLDSAGITVGKSRADIGSSLIKPLYVHLSPTNAEILHDMMVNSNNLFAESMLRILKPEGNLAEAKETEIQLLNEAGLDTSDLTVFDGSGLTRANRLTPRFMADLLTYMAFTHKAALYANLFPRVGIEGTVKALLADTPLAGKLALKSGSMKGVLCYAGYKLDETGTPTHAVVVMVNGFTCKMTTVRKAIAEFLLERFPQPDCTPKNPTIDKTFRNR